jgi:hypothetical protein
MRKRKEKIKAIGFGRLVTNQAQFLRGLSHEKNPHGRRQLFKSAKFDELAALVDIAYNVRYAPIPFWNRRQRDQLCGQATLVRKLARVRSPKSVRRLLLGSENTKQQPQHQNIYQNGRGPTAILPIASLLANIVLPYITDRLKGLKGN